MRGRFRNLALWLLCFGFLSPAFGEGLEGMPPYSCRVTYQLQPTAQDIQQNLVETVLCSATVISPTQLITAAHCAYGKNISSGTIECPGEDPVLISNTTLNPNYQGFRPGIHTCDTQTNDIAVIQTGAPLSAPPVRLPLSQEEVKRATQDPHSCSLSGYGVNASGDSTPRDLSHVSFQDQVSHEVEIETDENGNQKTIPEPDEVHPENRAVCGVMMLKDQVREGDSGSGLVCRDDENQPLLTGITQGVGSFDTTSVSDIVNISAYLPWIHQVVEAQQNQNPVHQPTFSSPPPSQHLDTFPFHSEF